MNSLRRPMQSLDAARVSMFVMLSGISPSQLLERGSHYPYPAPSCTYKKGPPRGRGARRFVIVRGGISKSDDKKIDNMEGLDAVVLGTDKIHQQKRKSVGIGRGAGCKPPYSPLFVTSHNQPTLQNCRLPDASVSRDRARARPAQPQPRISPRLWRLFPKVRIRKTSSPIASRGWRMGWETHWLAPPP